MHPFHLQIFDALTHRGASINYPYPCRVSRRCVPRSPFATASSLNVLLLQGCDTDGVISDGWCPKKSTGRTTASRPATASKRGTRGDGIALKPNYVRRSPLPLLAASGRRIVYFTEIVRPPDSDRTAQKSFLITADASHYAILGWAYGMPCQFDLRRKGHVRGNICIRGGLHGRTQTYVAIAFQADGTPRSPPIQRRCDVSHLVELLTLPRNVDTVSEWLRRCPRVARG
ncbi:hypothetical protein C8R47DRAFT_396154 [Mycena vitilis]|nr:hypothetical protein C8R47DRAFT_396154 [Mycena vitilis]